MKKYSWNYELGITGSRKEDKTTMIQVTDLSEEQLDEIGRAIGDSFFDHDYGEKEKGIAFYMI